MSLSKSLQSYLAKHGNNKYLCLFESKISAHVENYYLFVYPTEICWIFCSFVLSLYNGSLEFFILLFANMVKKANIASFSSNVVIFKAAQWFEGKKCSHGWFLVSSAK